MSVYVSDSSTGHVAKEVSSSRTFGPQALQELVSAGMEQRDGAVLERVGGIESLLETLGASASDGLHDASEAELNQRAKVYGSNAVAKRSEQSLWAIVRDAANDSTLWILSACGMVSLVLGALFENEDGKGWLEGASILGAVAVIVGVTAANNYQKEREFASLNEESDAALAVRSLRQGVEFSVPTRSLVVGDVVLCEGGDIVPADAILLEGDGVKVDESALTGESDEVQKSDDGDCIMLSGSKVMEGAGKMLIVAVGERSQQGIITSLIRQRADNDDTEAEQTVLQTKLAKLAQQIGYFGFGAGAVCTLGAAIEFTWSTFVVNGASWDISYLAQYVRFLINGTAIVVVAVPEGLPLAVTLALAVSVQRMLSDRNLVRDWVDKGFHDCTHFWKHSLGCSSKNFTQMSQVRYLGACETMGCATHILSDKTGTCAVDTLVPMHPQLQLFNYGDADAI